MATWELNYHWLLTEKVGKKAPDVGLEPTTLGLRVPCSTNWANQACTLECLLSSYFGTEPLHNKVSSPAHFQPAFCWLERWSGVSVEKLGMPKVTWPWRGITYTQEQLQCTAVTKVTESLNPTEKQTSNPGALKTSCWQNNMTIQVATAILLVYALLWAQNGNLERFILKARWQHRFLSLLCTEMVASLPWMKTRIVISTASVSKSSEQGALSHGARQTTSTLMPLVWKWSGYARQPLHVE